MDDDTPDTDDAQWSYAPPQIQHKILKVDSHPQSSWPPICLFILAGYVWGQTITLLLSDGNVKTLTSCTPTTLSGESTALLVIFGIVIALDAIILAVTKLRGVTAWGTFLTTCAVSGILLFVHGSQLVSCTRL